MARQHPIELFMPPNMLRAKAGGGFGGVDMAAIKRAESAMETLEGEFAGMAGDTVSTLAIAHRGFAAKAGPASRGALLRAAHDIKGLGATLGFPLMARVAGSLSRLLQESPQERPLPPKLIGAHVVAVQAIHRQAIVTPDDAPTLALLAELESQVGDALKT
jgi:chemotaxis protein histidine kinase CheA